jgi:hypothetical protein
MGEYILSATYAVFIALVIYVFYQIYKMEG